MIVFRGKIGTVPAGLLRGRVVEEVLMGSVIQHHISIVITGSERGVYGFDTRLCFSDFEIGGVVYRPIKASGGMILRHIRG